MPARGALALTGTLALALMVGAAGCDNNPHIRPQCPARADGTPWQVMYRGLPDNPRTLDPQVSYDTVSDAIVSQVYESLLQYRLFQTDPYEVEPCLAAAMPARTRNADGTETYAIALQPGIFFHDDPCFPGGRGREVVAADIAYAFLRMADPEVECPVLSLFAEFMPELGERYRAARAAAGGGFDYDSPPRCVEVTGRYALNLHLAKPFPQIQYWLAMPFTAPVPREAVEFYDGKTHAGATRDLFKFHPVGTGAFRLAEWRRNRLLRLLRHDRYAATRFPAAGWAAADDARLRPWAGAALPLVDEVQWTIIREAIPAWVLFRQGYLDRSGVGRDVFNTVLDAARELTPAFRARGITLYKDVEPGTFYAVFNMDDPVVGANANLRRAICAAYDEPLANRIFRNGIDLDAQQVVPPGVFGHDPDFRHPYKRHDLALAKRLMAEAGYPDGRAAATGEQLELSLDLVADSSQARQMAEFEKNQIEQLGIRVKIEENTWARLLDKMQRGLFQIYGSSGWNADYPDAENFFMVFYGKNIPPAGSNHGRYRNPEFDRLYDAMRLMDNGPERLAIIRRMNAIMAEDCPILPFYHPVSFSLAQPWLPRISSNPMARNGLKYALLDPAVRAAKIAAWNRAPRWPAAAALGALAALVAGAAAAARKHYG